MNIDELIRESIDESTDGRVPSPDLDAIRRGGRLRSTIRTGGAALATLGVVAAGTFAVQSFDGGSAEDLPASIRSQGPAITYISGSDWSVLHVGDRTYRPQHVNNEHHLGMSAPTQAGFVYIGDDDVPYLVDDKGVETPLSGTTNPAGQSEWFSSIATDTGRRYAAWHSNEHGGFVVNLFDSRERAVTGRQAIDPGDFGVEHFSDAYVNFIAGGVVYVNAWPADGGRFTIAWDPSLPTGKQVYRVTEPGTELMAIAKKTVLVKGKGAVYGSDGEPLGDGWTIRDPKDEGGSAHVPEPLSADGNWWVDSDSSGNMWAVNVHTGDRVDFGLNTGAEMYATSARMDDDGSVLVLSDDWSDGEEAGQISDCDITTGHCTTVIEELAGDQPGFPGDDAV